MFHEKKMIFFFYKRMIINFVFVVLLRTHINFKEYMEVNLQSLKAYALLIFMIKYQKMNHFSQNNPDSFGK